MRKRISFVLLFIIGLFICSSQTFAMTETWQNNSKFTRGVKNTCYYVDSTANSYIPKINSAAKSWASMNNKIKNTAVASKKGTHMDFYARTMSQDSNLTENMLAYTRFFDDKGITVQPTPITGPTKDYFYTDIIINKNSPITVGSDTMAHEMGHAYGLRHTGNTNSIMYSPMTYRNVIVPQSVDNDTINFLYPNG